MGVEVGGISCQFVTSAGFFRRRLCCGVMFSDVLCVVGRGRRICGRAPTESTASFPFVCRTYYCIVKASLFLQNENICRYSKLLARTSVVHTGCMILPKRTTKELRQEGIATSRLPLNHFAKCRPDKDTTCMTSVRGTAAVITKRRETSSQHSFSASPRPTHCDLPHCAKSSRWMDGSMVGEKRQVATLDRLQTSRLSLSESLSKRTT